MPVPPYKMRARPGGRARRGLSSTERLLDDGFRLRVEEMDAIGHEGQPDLLVRLRLDGGLDGSVVLLVCRRAGAFWRGARRERRSAGLAPWFRAGSLRRAA